MSNPKLYTLAQAFSLPLPKEYTTALKLDPHTSAQDVLELYAKKLAEPPPAAPVSPPSTDQRAHEQNYKELEAKLFGLKPGETVEEHFQEESL